MGIWSRLKKYRDMDIEAEEKKRFSEAEPGDFPAMLLAAIVTLFLPCVLILVFLVLVVLALFGAL